MKLSHESAAGWATALITFLGIVPPWVKFISEVQSPMNFFDAYSTVAPLFSIAGVIIIAFSKRTQRRAYEAQLEAQRQRNDAHNQVLAAEIGTWRGSAARARQALALQREARTIVRSWPETPFRMRPFDTGYWGEVGAKRTIDIDRAHDWHKRFREFAGEEPYNPVSSFDQVMEWFDAKVEALL